MSVKRYLGTSLMVGVDCFSAGGGAKSGFFSLVFLRFSRLGDQANGLL